MLTAPRKIKQLASEAIPYGVAANVKIYQGAMVVLDAGFAEPGKSAANLASVGIAFTGVDNTGGADGDQKVDCRRGTWQLDNDAGTPVTIADIGEDCFVLDDHTVSGDGTGRSVAGEIINVDAGGVWVKF